MSFPILDGVGRCELQNEGMILPSRSCPSSYTGFIMPKTGTQMQPQQTRWGRTPSSPTTKVQEYYHCSPTYTKSRVLLLHDLLSGRSSYMKIAKTLDLSGWEKRYVNT